MNNSGDAGREAAKVAFLVTGSKRRLEGTAAELDMVVQGRWIGELRTNIASALKVRFGRDQAFSMLVGTRRTDKVTSTESR